MLARLKPIFHRPMVQVADGLYDGKPQPVALFPHVASVEPAELLRREYWKVSPWIGVAGYAVAAGTGFFRMYNNRHWLTDVIAGAGIGILSVQAAYWLYPTISKTFFRKRYLKNVRLAPYASQQEKGVACSIVF